MADYCQLGDLFARKQYTFFKVTFRTMICLFYIAYVAIKKSTIHHLLAFYIKRFPVRGEQIDKYIKHFIYIYIKRFVRNEIINFSSSSQLISSLTIKNETSKKKSETIPSKKLLNLGNYLPRCCEIFFIRPARKKLNLT